MSNKTKSPPDPKEKAPMPPASPLSWQHELRNDVKTLKAVEYATRTMLERAKFEVVDGKLRLTQCTFVTETE